MLNINVYDFDFDKSTGYKLIEKDGINLLIIKLDDLNDCFKESFKKFLDLDIDSLEKTNIGENKYELKYNQFKKTLKFNKQFVDDIYSSEYCNYFYSDKELDRFKLKWSE